MEQGIKHLVTCRCVLPQFEELADPPFHQFTVFSVLEDDEIIPKYAQCTSCNVIHKIVDICKSEIMGGREHMASIMSIDDIKLSIPEQLSAILEKHDVQYASWEHAKWILDNERWGEHIVLSSETIEGLQQIKYVRILGRGLFQMNSHSGDVYI